MLKKAFPALFISFSIFIAIIYLLAWIFNSLKLTEKYYLTSNTDFLENHKKITKIYNFCDKISTKNNIKIININNKTEANNLIKNKEFGNIIYACKTNFSQNLTPDFAYFHNVKTLEEISNNKVINSEIDYKEKVNLFLDFIKNKNIIDYGISHYNYNKIAKKTDILIEFSNNLPEPNLRDWDTSNDDNKHIEFIEWHGSEDIKWKRITGIFFGDAHFGRWFEYFTREWFKKESDYFEKFYENNDIKNNLEEKIHRRLYGFDIVWLNLETAVASKTECQKSSKSIVLKTLPKFLNNFKEVGFNYYNIANNHSFDCGRSWFNATKKHLESNNLNYFGNMAGEENILKQEINSIKVAFIWVNDTFWNIPWAGINYKNLTKKIKDIKKEGYKIIINIHWWEEYKLENNKRQSKLAKQLVDAWVDLIIGHHPHVVQNYTTIDWVPVFYSLWNFVFDQPFPDTIKWMAVMFEIWEKGLKAFPIYFTRDNKRYFVDKFLDSKFENSLK